MEAMEKKSDDNPAKAFSAGLCRNPFPGVVAWNIIKEVTEKHRAINDDTANSWNDVWFSRVGLPLRLSVPPGKVVELAKATVAMRHATT
ncbi:hypothetical protein L484_002353 [Morus notabilis]|uniref:Uncharacterized protein n=1 Tax=Morus notabilis TaxID=981085 RepID=W9RCF2_9ROSA|nr:hypothetical protein L484_002353 [Morus notabilis]